MSNYRVKGRSAGKAEPSTKKMPRGNGMPSTQKSTGSNQRPNRPPQVLPGEKGKDSK